MKRLIIVMLALMMLASSCNKNGRVIGGAEGATGIYIGS